MCLGALEVLSWEAAGKVAGDPGEDVLADCHRPLTEQARRRRALPAMRARWLLLDALTKEVSRRLEKLDHATRGERMMNRNLHMTAMTAAPLRSTRRETAGRGRGEPWKSVTPACRAVIYYSTPND